MIANYIKKHFRIITVLLFLFAGKSMLLGTGHLDDTDENPFILLLDNFDQLLAGNLDAWNYQVLVLWSTYPETAIRLFEAFFLKIYASYLHLPPTHIESLKLMGLFNVFVSLAQVIVFYLILIRLKFDKNTALAGILIYSAFLNTNLYIKHILPYDMSLLLYLISLYIILSEKLSLKKLFIVGVLSSIGFYCYFGNFMFSAILFIVLVFKQFSQPKSLAKHTVIFLTPYLLFLLSLELISRQSGKSYIMHTLVFSGTIYHGSPEESLIYLFNYFFVVEKFWGILMIVSLTISFFLVLKIKIIEQVKIVVSAGAIAYMVYAIYATATGGMVFYGRVIHMYIPFVVIFILYFLQIFNYVVISLSLIAAVNFLLVIKELNSLGYPRSIVYQKNLFDSGENISFYSELRCGITYDYRHPYFFDAGIEHSWPDIYMEVAQKKKFEVPHQLINFCFFFHYPDDFIDKYQKFSPPVGYQKIYEKKHFMSHPAYTFEYCTKIGRKFFIEKDLKIQIFRAN
jgi:hypothetical protein